MSPSDGHNKENNDSKLSPAADNDDAAEAAGYKDRSPEKSKATKFAKKAGGQNTKRTFGRWCDQIQLCSSRTYSAEFSPEPCQYGDKCRFEHDLRKYLSEGKREDLKTFVGAECPVWKAKGICNSGWKCRFVGSHSMEKETDDGRKELVLVQGTDATGNVKPLRPNDADSDVANIVKPQQRAELAKKKRNLSKSDAYIQWLDKRAKANMHKDQNGTMIEDETSTTSAKEEKDSIKSVQNDNRAQYTEPPFLPSEKRRIYYGPETPILAPLTTQGNLPFRRLCVDLGAHVTWSEMALGMNLIKGEKGEWALLRAHESELESPKLSPSSSTSSSLVTRSPYPSLAQATALGYNSATDVKFGAQIAANKPWIALKTTEVLSSLCPRLRAIDLNCGCPIDMVFRQGAGSALLDAPSKLEKMLRGMNALSGEIPITLKIRTGTKDGHPTAQRLVERLVLGSESAHERGEGPPGIAAITLHGRSRQQRYTKTADWGYIAECAALVKRLEQRTNRATDTVAEPDPRDLPNTYANSPSSFNNPVYFIGNGDCYSPQQYYDQINNSGVNAVMVGRGALLKPWLFEELDPQANPSGTDIDKSATERLGYVEKFVRYGLDTWGSDEVGVGTTRRFLLEWLSFAHRYVPVGLLEYLPPRLNERPPPFKGRSDLETLLASADHRDWIRIRYGCMLFSSLILACCSWFFVYCCLTSLYISSLSLCD